MLRQGSRESHDEASAAPGSLSTNLESAIAPWELPRSAVRHFGSSKVEMGTMGRLKELPEPPNFPTFPEVLTGSCRRVKRPLSGPEVLEMTQHTHAELQRL